MHFFHVEILSSGQYGNHKQFWRHITLSNFCQILAKITIVTSIQHLLQWLQVLLLKVLCNSVFTNFWKLQKFVKTLSQSTVAVKVTLKIVLVQLLQVYLQKVSLEEICKIPWITPFSFCTSKSTVANWLANWDRV